MNARQRATLGVTAMAVALGVGSSFAQRPTGGTDRPRQPASATAPKPGQHYFVKYHTGKIYPRDGLITELKLTADMTEGRLTFIDEVWYPGFTVRPHFHIEHSEIFYVLSGQVEWTVAGEMHLLGAGDLIYIPSDTPHQVRVVGNEDSRCLMIYEPGSHEIHLEDEQRYTADERKKPEIVEALRSLYDFNPTEMIKPIQTSVAKPGLPERGKGNRSVRPAQAAPYPIRQRFVMKAQGEPFSPENETSVVKLSAADTDGRFSLLDEVWKPGMNVPPHYHAGHAEIFFVLDGEVEWTVGGEKQVLKHGDLVYIPPKTVHSTKVLGSKDVKILMLYNPGGYEYYWRRESQYTPEQLKQPEIQRMLRTQSDTYAVTK